MPAEPAFDAKTHLDYQPPVKRHSMKELGLDPSAALCDFAVTEPFQLLSSEGVAAVREVTMWELLKPGITRLYRCTSLNSQPCCFQELFSKAVQQNCKFTSKRTPRQVPSPQLFP